MAKIRLAPAVWTNFGAFVLSGAGAVTGASAQQVLVQIIGWVGMVFGLGILVWGITINGEHWWARSRIRMSWPYALMAFCALGFAIGAIAAWQGSGKASPVEVETPAPPAGEAALNTYEVKEGAKQPTEWATASVEADDPPPVPSKEIKPLHVFVECSFTGTPKRVPASGKFEIVGFSVRDGLIKGGLGKYDIGDPGAEVKWPTPNQVPVKCSVTNYSDTPLFDLSFEFEVVAHETITEGNTKSTGNGIIGREVIQIQLPRLEAGEDHPLELYMENQSDYFLSIKLNRRAAAKLIGRDTVSNVQVSMPKYDELITLLPR